MVKLAELGFLENVITEAIVTTHNMNGQPNAAPMGVIMTDARTLVTRPYTSTQTAKNLRSKKCAVINLTSNPELFYRTAFKEVNPNGRLPVEWFRPAEKVDSARLQVADAFIEVTVKDITDFETERINALCQVELIKASKVPPKVYCRALHAVIESIVHATRVKALIADEHEREHVQGLLKKFDEYRCLVERVAPNSLYSKIMDDLSERIILWRNNCEGIR